jgi:hypothetical protein
MKDELRTQLEVATKALAAMREILDSAEETDKFAPSTPEKAVERHEDQRCIVCNEALPIKLNGRADHIRGACVRCHKQISRTIAAGRLTEEEVVQRGWLLPPKKGGRPPKLGSISYRLMQEELAAKELAAKKKRPKQ